MDGFMHPYRDGYHMFEGWPGFPFLGWGMLLLWLLVFLVIGVLVYLCGVEGAEREGSLRKGGGESGAPSSLSHRTGILYAGGSPR